MVVGCYLRADKPTGIGEHGDIYLDSNLTYMQELSIAEGVWFNVFVASVLLHLEPHP